MISELMFLMRLQNERFRQLVSGDLGRFSFVKTGRPDQSVSKWNRLFPKLGFSLLLKHHLIRAYHLGFDLSGWIVLIKSEILITTWRCCRSVYWQMGNALKLRLNPVRFWENRSRQLRRLYETLAPTYFFYRQLTLFFLSSVNFHPPSPSQPVISSWNKG